MAIAQNLPTIPRTPEPPSGLPPELPPFLAVGRLKPLVEEFNRTREKYGRRARQHREVANEAAMKDAVRADDLAHASAVREGHDDPGPVNVTAWRAEEEVARRAVTGARDALRLVYNDLLSELDTDAVGGKVQDSIEGRRDKAATAVTEAVETLRARLADLDEADAQAHYLAKARQHATAKIHNNGHRPDGFNALWPTGAPIGNPQSVIVDGRVAPVENVLHGLLGYRER